MQSHQSTIDLQDVTVARPCRASWDAMRGTGSVRLCGSCHKNVYNLSELTKAEGEDLLRRHAGPMCVRLYRRADGTLITADCPVGVRQARRPLAWIAAGCALLGTWGAALVRQPQAHADAATAAPTNILAERIQGWSVSKAMTNWLNPTPVSTVVMGVMAMPTPTPVPTATPKE